MNWWQSILVAAGGGGLTTFLAFLLSSSARTSGLAKEAMGSMGKSLKIQEQLRAAMVLQNERIDNWERWGRKMQRAWELLMQMLEAQGVDISKMPTMPEPPQLAPLDLSKIFDDE